jgi:hypothetical protein
MHSEFGGNYTENNSALGQDVHTCTSECSLWGTNGNGRNKWRYKNTSCDRLCFMWVTSWKRRNNWTPEHNRARCTEFVEQRKNYRDSNGANASQVWHLHTFLNLFFISEFWFSMISLLISPQNFVDISYFKRAMHDVLLEFISLDLSTSPVWQRPHVFRSRSVWSCACCDDACLYSTVLW